MNTRPDNANQNYDTASSIIHRLEKQIPTDEDITVEEFLKLLGVHGFVIFILVLALLNIAIFMLPGLSILFGVPMVIMAVQLLSGIDAPIIPAFIRSRTLGERALRTGLDWAAKVLEKIEPAIKPRLEFLTHPALLRIHAFVVLILAFMVAIPIPFINIPPTIAIIMLMLGFMQRDGVCIIGSYVFGMWSLWLYESLGRAAVGLN